MADTGDFKMHDDTYQGFISLMKWGGLATIVVTALVIVLIAN
ncbi:aa3-type cytochrome c oxidase subunit IV [Sphingomonas sp. C3-2]|nr:aa3-type cytochrome c oxidase subunit IV [Sphingomonas sp. C3-2]WOK36275.1 aa3-type cytochrome c oxidase subunit IV [Sphingomonas sp. C3-2]